MCIYVRVYIYMYPVLQTFEGKHFAKVKQMMG